MQRTLNLLNARLSEDDGCSDSSIYIIMILAMMAIVLREFMVGSVHMTSLRQIVQLRGGLGYLHSSNALLPNQMLY